jgi:hypothetical protein
MGLCCYQLCNDLYPHYQLPDGRIVHFHFMDLLHETVFEYVNSGPPVPSTLQSVRQKALSDGVSPVSEVDQDSVDCNSNSVELLCVDDDVVDVFASSCVCSSSWLL